jgi:hypothetical protein
MTAAHIDEDGRLIALSAVQASSRRSALWPVGQTNNQISAAVIYTVGTGKNYANQKEDCECYCDA